ncbi:MAG: hypothetical protein R3182_11935, partial [Draconibacterium sp.]|nr:hypothetical protein [Draconibacterium sp.]
MKKILSLLFLFLCFFTYAQENQKLPIRERFNENWKFERFGQHQFNQGEYVDEPTGLETVEFNDKKWRNLN